MANKEIRDFRIFFSWQSDLEDNTRLIRECLHLVNSGIIETLLTQGIQIVIDEATKNCPGSPSIPDKICEKIRYSDAFVCDITPIYLDVKSGEQIIPNPNVIFELGYAVAHLGWNRIILLFNKAYGPFPEGVPFDIEHHRVSPYEFAKEDDSLSSAKKKERKEPLKKLLCEAIGIIIKDNPIRPIAKPPILPAERKRDLDINTLKLIFSVINIVTLEEHISNAPFKIHTDIFYFWENFNGIISSSLFHLYDKKLQRYVTNVHQSWDQSLSYGHQYRPSPFGDQSFFGNSMDLPFTEGQQADWEVIKLSIRKLRQNLFKLLQYVRDNYLEVDIDELSNDAWRKYIEYVKECESK